MFRGSADAICICVCLYRRLEILADKFSMVINFIQYFRRILSQDGTEATTGVSESIQ
jgi:hypothetical protein